MELDRNLGIFLRGGIRQLIGAAEAVQQPRQGLFLLGRGPAFQEEGLFGVHEPLLIELLLDLLHHAVVAQLELQTALLAGGDGFLQAFALLLEALPLRIQIGKGLLCGAGDALKGGVAEAVGLQCFQCCLLLRPVAHEQQVMYLGIGGSLIELRCVGGKGKILPDMLEIRRGGHHAELHIHRGGGLGAQRDLQRLPWLQGLAGGGDLLDPRRGLLKLGGVMVDLPDNAHGLGSVLLAEQLVLQHLGLGSQQL